MNSSRSRGAAIVLTLCALSTGCEDGRPAPERVEAFCSSIKKGESIHSVLARYEEFALQPGGVPPPAAERLRSVVPDEVLRTVAGRLAEPSGSPVGARPVCAIYYSSHELGGDDKVVLAEFRRDWTARY